MEASAAHGDDARPGRPRRGIVSARLLRVASDERLVGLVRGGSEPAFEVIYDRHHRGILSFCRHMLGSREEAEDALQHTFMAAYRALLDSERDMQLRAWLYAIARNRCLSVLRSRRERPLDDLDEPVTEGLAVEVQQRQDLKDMLADLAALPEDQREALVLSELGALPHEEIAAVLDVPKDKVKALVFQARSSLQHSREARETDCQAIREMLSELRGGALRRTTLRRHLAGCPGCREFEAEVKRQRRAMAAVLPVLPTLGLKESALAAAFGSKAATGAVVAGTAATAAGAAAGGTVAAGGTGALLAKVLVVAAVASGGAVGVKTVADSGDPARSSGSSGIEAPSGKPAPPAPAETAEAREAAEERAEQKAEARAKAQRKARENRGTANALTRGRGKKLGLRGTQPGQNRTTERGKSEAAKERAAAKKKKARKRAKRPLKAKRTPTATPKPDPTPRPTPRPKATPTPTPAPTVEPVPEPTTAGGGGGGNGNGNGSGSAG